MAFGESASRDFNIRGDRITVNENYARAESYRSILLMAVNLLDLVEFTPVEECRGDLHDVRSDHSDALLSRCSSEPITAQLRPNSLARYRA